jgi:hypothetical protein
VSHRNAPSRAGSSSWRLRGDLVHQLRVARPAARAAPAQRLLRKRQNTQAPHAGQARSVRISRSMVFLNCPARLRSSRSAEIASIESGSQSLRAEEKHFCSQPAARWNRLTLFRPQRSNRHFCPFPLSMLSFIGPPKLFPACATPSGKRCMQLATRQAAAHPNPHDTGRKIVRPYARCHFAGIRPLSYDNYALEHATSELQQYCRLKNDYGCCLRSSHRFAELPQ